MGQPAAGFRLSVSSSAAGILRAGERCVADVDRRGQRRGGRGAPEEEGGRKEEEAKVNLHLQAGWSSQQ